uniref:Uncharacterized protein n=1 Tax=Romanomermis culicivorax TaxID=13658 RepID=A0A915KY91_ROMCU
MKNRWGIELKHFMVAFPQLSPATDLGSPSKEVVVVARGSKECFMVGGMGDLDLDLEFDNDEEEDHDVQHDLYQNYCCCIDSDGSTYQNLWSVQLKYDKQYDLRHIICFSEKS